MKDVNEALSAGARLDQLLAAADAGDILEARARDGELTEIGLQLMDDVAEALKSVQDLEEARERLGQLFEERALSALGAAYRCRAPAVESRLFRLSGPRGVKDLIKTLQRAIKNAAENQSVTASSLASLLKNAGDERLRKLEAPPGYTVDLRGVWTDGGEENVARAPIFVRRIARDLHRGTLRWTLSWYRGRRWEEADIDRRRACDSQGLISLADLGAPVSSDNARALIRYLTHFEAHNAGRIPEDTYTTHLGWQSDDMYVCSPADARIRVSVADGEADVMRGWGVEGGTWDGWCATVRELVAPYPLAMLAVYAALVPVLLRPLGEDGFTIDWSGDSSGGKTTTLRVAASVWGYPDKRDGGIIRAWDSASGVAPAAIAAVLHSVPLLMDDTQYMQSERQREGVAGMLYALPGGRERQRGNQDGGLRAPRSWHTCMLSTGESPITTFSGDTGARARALCLNGPPFAHAGSAVVDSLRERLLEHHGFLGPRFVAYVLARRGEIRERWVELRSAHTSGVEDSVTARISAYVALLQLVAEIVHEQLGVPGDWHDALYSAAQAARTSGHEADRPLEALRDLYTWAVERLDQFYQPAVRNQRRPLAPWLGRWDPPDGFSVGKQTVIKLLTEWGYPHANVLRSWRERGWTRCEKDRLDTYVELAGQRSRMVSVEMSPVVRAALGL